jgi:hypothetical protein
MANEQWHLSKSVPISFIVAIIGQTAALVWFIASMNNEIEVNARDIVRHDARIEVLADSVQENTVTLARIGESIEAIRATLERMERNSRGDN